MIVVIGVQMYPANIYTYTNPCTYIDIYKYLSIYIKVGIFREIKFPLPLLLPKGHTAEFYFPLFFIFLFCISPSIEYGKQISKEWCRVATHRNAFELLE